MTQPTISGSSTVVTLNNASGGSRAHSFSTGTLTSPAGLLLVPWESSADRSAGFNSGGGGATWIGGGAMTYVGGIAVNVTAQGLYAGIAAFAIPGIASSASGNVTVTNSAESGLFMGAWIAAYDNVNQSTPTSGFVTNSSATSSTAPSIAVTSTTNDRALGLALMMNVSVGGVSAGSGETAVGSIINENASYTDARGLVVENAGTNPTLDWTFTTSDGGVWLAFSLQGTGGGGGGSAAVENVIWMN